MKAYKRHQVFAQVAETYGAGGNIALLQSQASFQKHFKTKVLLPGSTPEVLSTSVTSKTQMWASSNEILT